MRLRGRALATAEKALLDFFHHSSGNWTVPRCREMRFSGSESLDFQKLESMAQALGKPRLLRAVSSWSHVVRQEVEGEITL